MHWIVVAAAIGFPFAMLFSWWYESTPHGMQRESEISPNESTTRQTGKKLDRWKSWTESKSSSTASRTESRQNEKASRRLRIQIDIR
jgi:hypothetical protein